VIEIGVINVVVLVLLKRWYVVPYGTGGGSTVGGSIFLYD
jgi:hypothetical protein